MSRYALYIVWDNKAEDITGGLAAVHKADAPAMRMFADMVTRPNSPLAQHADDYELVCIGTLDDNGEINSAERRIVTTARLIVAAANAHAHTSEGTSNAR